MFESCDAISITSLGNCSASSTPLIWPHIYYGHAENYAKVCVCSYSIVFESFCIFEFYLCSGSEEDLFYDAPSSPIGDRPFFSDNPMPLRYAAANKRQSLVKEDSAKNMTEFIMSFEISEV